VDVVVVVVDVVVDVGEQNPQVLSQRWLYVQVSQKISGQTVSKPATVVRNDSHHASSLALTL